MLSTTTLSDVDTSTSTNPASETVIRTGTTDTTTLQDTSPSLAADVGTTASSDSASDTTVPSTSDSLTTRLDSTESSSTGLLTTTVDSKWPTPGPRKPKATPPPDPCLSSPCDNNNTCTSREGVFQCECLDSFAGVFCQQAIVGICPREQCSRGAVGCYLVSDNSTIREFCGCAPGYNGSKCEAQKDECLSQPCLNGACSDLIDAFTCQCNRGWEGAQCEYDINECASTPCRMNGTCHETSLGLYICKCPFGFAGSSCETNVDDCKGVRCMNGGMCIDGIGNFTCKCPTNYYGVFCDGKASALVTVEQASHSFATVAIVAIVALFLAVVLGDVAKCFCKNHFPDRRQMIEKPPLKQEGNKPKAKRQPTPRQQPYRHIYFP